MLQPTTAHAHFSLGDPNPGGIEYRGTAAIHNLTSIQSDTYHVGAWSWDDNSLGANTGWTHTSNWYAVELDIPGRFVLTISRQENVPWPSTALPDRVASTANLFPSFSLYTGWDNDDDVTHEYTNNGNIAWAEDLTYIGHMNNSTETSISAFYDLPAGQYTLVVGSNSPGASVAERQGYRATFQAVAVPEPSTAFLAVAGGLAMLARRRRRA